MVSVDETQGSASGAARLSHVPLGLLREREIPMTHQKQILTLGATVLAATSVALAHNAGPYPSERIAGFVVEKLEVSSLPSAYRPKKEKGKQTLANYGFTVEKLEEDEAVVASEGGTRRLSIRILQEDSSGIYACMTENNSDDSETKAQSVVVLKHKDADQLLKAHESKKEFSSCPLLGESAMNETY
jgi:hypothetical protein